MDIICIAGSSGCAGGSGGIIFISMPCGSIILGLGPIWPGIIGKGMTITGACLFWGFWLSICALISSCAFSEFSRDLKPAKNASRKSAISAPTSPITAHMLSSRVLSPESFEEVSLSAIGAVVVVSVGWGSDVVGAVVVVVNAPAEATYTLTV